jgi:hypothetical protein
MAPEFMAQRPRASFPGLRFKYGMTIENPQVFRSVTQQVWQSWQKTAPERMGAYVMSGDDIDVLDPIARYLWNRALGEALTPSLHMFEVAVRNAVHWSMSKETKRDDWFNVSGMLEHREQQRVDEARKYIEERGKQATPGRIVAELTLGFWTALFSSPYEASIVHPVLARGMKNIPPEQKRGVDIL